VQATSRMTTTGTVSVSVRHGAQFGSRLV